MSLDRDDNDPKRLWTAVVAALAACPSVPPGSRLHAPWVWQPGAQPEFLAELTDAVQQLPRPIRLILDDVHELVDPVALHGLQTLLRNRPTGFQLVLSTRFDPPLSLPRLRLAGRLCELRADRLRFSPTETATLLERSGLNLTPTQVDTLHQRTGGWAAGLRLAALALTRTTDRDAFLDQFSGNDSSVADYLVGEVLSALPDDIQEFLRVISISDPVPSGLAAQLSGREDAGSLLDRLAHHTSLLTATGHHRDTYRIQELLRTYLSADLQRQGPTRAAELHATAAHWWAGQDQPINALDHATRSRNPALLSELLHRFAMPLILTGDHGPVRRALAGMDTQATASDPWLALTGALTRLEAGDLSAARADLRHVRQCWPSHDTAELAVLQAAVEQLAAPSEKPSPTGAATDLSVSRPTSAWRPTSTHCRPNRPWRHSPAWPGAPRCSNATTGPGPAPSSRPRWTWAAATASTTCPCNAWCCSASSPAPPVTCAPCWRAAPRRSPRPPDTAGRAQPGRPPPPR